MGSEGPKAFTIHVTGFKKFQGVAENPTETIVTNLKDFVEKRGLPLGVTLGTCTILETAGDGALPLLYQTLESGISRTDGTSNEQVVWVICSLRKAVMGPNQVVFTTSVLPKSGLGDILGKKGCSEELSECLGNGIVVRRRLGNLRIYGLTKCLKKIDRCKFIIAPSISIQMDLRTVARSTLESEFTYGARIEENSIHWLHLGVNSGAQKFAIERKAINEATFRCPDELGWQPQRIPIVSEDGGISRARETSCCVEGIRKFLKEKGFDVALSDDAGRFVCNYVYYHSLRFAELKGHKSLFVHVPLFTKINQETQIRFVASVLEAIASTC